MADPTAHRRQLADGRVMVVQYEDSLAMWSARVEGAEDDWVVGGPLVGVIAEAAGYRVGTEEWPQWVDDWAAEIQTGELRRRDGR